MDNKLRKLLTIIPDTDRVITGDSIEEVYKSDVLGRLKGTVWAVVRTVSTNEVSGVLSFAFENDIPVTPRGAGTNLVGSTVPLSGGIVLDLTAMNKILELDKETFTATVEPGVVLQDFQEYVEKEGFFYPPDPGEKTATIGGNISTNAGGMRAVKYGVTRDYVMGLEIVLADGRVLTVGSKNIKDSSGLSLKNLIIGSEGTLAVITKCILKVIPKPQSSVSVLVPFNSLDKGIESVQHIINQNANPTAIEFVERKVIKLGEEFLQLSFPYPQAKAYLILTFDGYEEEIERNIRRIEETVRKHGALEFLRLTDKETAANVWRIRGALVKAVEAVSEQEPVDIVVPINKTAEFVEFVNKLSEKTNMQMISFGHAGDGNVHLCVLRGNRSESQWEDERKENMDKIYTKAYQLGGLTSGEHGIGISKKRYYLKETDKTNIDVMNAIKNSLDSKHILNDHKV
ncbi:FAD-binding oxidoreductase, partial [Anaerosporobacter sp.]